MNLTAALTINSAFRSGAVTGLVSPSFSFAMLLLALGALVPADSRGQSADAASVAQATNAASRTNLPAPGPSSGTVAGSNAVPGTAAPGKELKLPGLVINREQWSVDIESTICLREGALEVIACTKGTKEHESIVVVEAKPLHVHAALLLLGAQPGNPAMRKLVGENRDRWLDIPPRGGPVDVYLVVEDKDKKLVERPISDFIISSKELPEGAADGAGKFPTHTFLFAGSMLIKGDSGPGKYLCDDTGNLISITTFGDEVLCLPEVHSNDNEALLWRVKGEETPAVGTKVILRLRPKIERAAPINKARPRLTNSVPPKVGP